MTGFMPHARFRVLMSCPLSSALTLLLVTSAFAAALPPHVFFSDLDSGPSSGGEKNGGVYVTIYGARFGTTRGSSSVTVGGGAVASYTIWTDTKITVQLGRLAATGPIVV